MPKGIHKSVADIMEGSRLAPGKKDSKKNKVAEPQGKYSVDTDIDLNSPKAVSKKIEEIEKKMYQAAKDLEFETVAALRDQLAELRDKMKVI